MTGPSQTEQLLRLRHIRVDGLLAQAAAARQSRDTAQHAVRAATQTIDGLMAGPAPNFDNLFEKTKHIQSGQRRIAIVNHEINAHRAQIANARASLAQAKADLVDAENAVAQALKRLGKAQTRADAVQTLFDHDTAANALLAAARADEAAVDQFAANCFARANECN